MYKVKQDIFSLIDYDFWVDIYERQVKSWRFSVSSTFSFTFRPMIHLSQFLYVVRDADSSFFFLHIDIQLFQYPLLKMLSFSHWIAFIEKSIYHHNVKFYFWTNQFCSFHPCVYLYSSTTVSWKMVIQLTLKQDSFEISSYIQIFFTKCMLQYYARLSVGWISRC